MFSVLKKIKFCSKDFNNSIFVMFWTQKVRITRTKPACYYAFPTGSLYRLVRKGDAVAGCQLSLNWLHTIIKACLFEILFWLIRDRAETDKNFRSHG